MSEFSEGIEIMRDAALNAIKEADSLEHAAHMIKETKFFFDLEEGA